MPNPALRVLLALDRFIGWLFGPRAPWADLFLGALAGGWAALMIRNPAMFGAGGSSGYAALAWLPDNAWIGMHLAVAGMHGLGLARPLWDTMRAVTCLASAFPWLCLSWSFYVGNGWTPGVLVYGLLAAQALLVSLHVGWHGRRLPAGA